MNSPAMVLVPADPAARDYGANLSIGYDAAGQRPFLYDGTLPDGIEPMERVVAIETAPKQHEAWSLSFIRQSGHIESGDVIITWEPGQASALDKHTIAAGRDVGNVIVQRRVDGSLIDVPYDVTFAFVFRAFRPKSPIHQSAPEAEHVSE